MLRVNNLDPCVYAYIAYNLARLIIEEKPFLGVLVLGMFFFDLGMILFSCFSLKSDVIDVLG